MLGGVVEGKWRSGYGIDQWVGRFDTVLPGMYCTVLCCTYGPQIIQGGLRCTGPYLVLVPMLDRVQGVEYMG